MGRPQQSHVSTTGNPIDDADRVWLLWSVHVWGCRLVCVSVEYANGCVGAICGETPSVLEGQVCLGSRVCWVLALLLLACCVAFGE